MAKSLNISKQNQNLNWSEEQAQFIQKCVQKHGQPTTTPNQYKVLIKI